jgi:hypothetical protein
VLRSISGDSRPVVFDAERAARLDAGLHAHAARHHEGVVQQIAQQLGQITLVAAEAGVGGRDLATTGLSA